MKDYHTIFVESLHHHLRRARKEFEAEFILVARYAAPPLGLGYDVIGTAGCIKRPQMWDAVKKFHADLCNYKPWARGCLWWIAEPKISGFRQVAGPDGVEGMFPVSDTLATHWQITCHLGCE